MQNEPTEANTDILTITGQKLLKCKYGENGHQTPAYAWKDKDISVENDPLAFDKFIRLRGTDLSYNNICDWDRLLQTMTHIGATFFLNRDNTPYIAIAVKHGNACGVGISYKSAGEAVRRMLEGNPLAIFGGLVMCNFEINHEIAELFLHYQSKTRRLFDAIFAACFTEQALDLLDWRKENKCRLLYNPALASLDTNSLDSSLRFRKGRGIILTQPNYEFILDLKHPQLEKHGKFPERIENDILLAKAIGDTSNSNTITIVLDGMLIGNGVGQQSRVFGAEVALLLAVSSKHKTLGAVASSDSFFPFVDGVEVLAKAGIKAIISTKGSQNDKQVIARCEELGISLMLLPDPDARGFFGH